MRQQLFAIFFIAVATTSTFAQTTPGAIKGSTVASQKFYFPSKLYTDSTALGNAIPELAEQVLTAYHNSNKRTYYDNSIPVYLLAGDYAKAIAFVDSVRKIDGDSSYGIDLKSYALAKIAGQKQKDALETTFKKEYKEAFNKLSFRKKVNAATADTSWITYTHKDFVSFKETLLKTKSDSLS